MTVWHNCTRVFSKVTLLKQSLVLPMSKTCTTTTDATNLTKRNTATQLKIAMLPRDVVSARRPLSMKVRLHTETKRRLSSKVKPRNMDKVANRQSPTYTNPMEVWMPHLHALKPQFAPNEENEDYHNIYDYDNDE